MLSLHPMQLGKWTLRFPCIRKKIKKPAILKVLQTRGGDKFTYLENNIRRTLYSERRGWRVNISVLNSSGLAFICRRRDTHFWQTFCLFSSVSAHKLHDATQLRQRNIFTYPCTCSTY
jgi:hypothetical protein